MTEKPGLDSIESADQRTCKVVCILTEKEKQTGGSIVKKWKWLLLVGTLIAGCAGCGAQKPEETGAVDIKAVDVVQPESGMDAADAAAEREAEEKNDSYDDLGEKRQKAMYRILRRRFNWWWQQKTWRVSRSCVLFRLR